MSEREGLQPERAVGTCEGSQRVPGATDGRPGPAPDGREERAVGTCEGSQRVRGATDGRPGLAPDGREERAQRGAALLAGPLADRDAWTAERCTIGKAMEIVGTRSALLLMREAYYGTRRFDDFARRVGITAAVAATRLRELVDAGLLDRRPYREPGQRTRDEYVLTAMGRDLLPAALALMQWGDRYLSGPDGPPLAVRHHGCGEPVRVEVRCAAGHQVPLAELSVGVAGRRGTPAPAGPSPG